MSVKFRNGHPFNSFCAEHIENYDPDRFEILALRVYSGKETYVTVFAVDRSRQENTKVVDKIPVKKFRLNIEFIADLLPYIDEWNFTLTTGSFPLSDMEVVNR
jgi:hypothetical protein